jgi:predicted nucleic acid-binding protein
VKKPIFVLDSFALLAFLQAEPPGLIVKDLLRRARAGDALTFMSIINLGEVIYITGRKLGKAVATDILHDVSLLPIQLAEATLDRVLAAAGVKAEYPISYADTFAVALANELDAAIVSGDPEFRQVESLVQIKWL